MKQSHTFAVGVAAALSLGIGIAAYAQPGQMGGAMGPHMKGGMQHGAMAGMQYGARGGAQHGMTGGPRHGLMGGGAAGQGAGQELTTPEERGAMIEKMRNASTLEERVKIAEEHRAEMDKRAREKGITLPAHRGPHFGGTRQAPATN